MMEGDSYGIYHMVVNMLFATGDIVITRGAREKISPNKVGLALGRHFAGDWGNLSAEDWKMNDEALMEHTRLFSVYEYDGVKFWIITEADWSVTTVLLPDEY